MKLKETRRVSRPLAEVFDYTVDFSHIADWDPGIVDSKALGDPPPREGSKYELMVKLGSGTERMIYEITELEPNRRVVLVGTGEKLTAIDEIAFRSDNNDTVIDYTAELRFSGLLKWIAPLMAPGIKKVGRRAVDGLVRKLEQ